MDKGGIPVLRNDLAMYASVTEEDEGIVLWYPALPCNICPIIAQMLADLLRLFHLSLGLYI